MGEWIYRYVHVFLTSALVGGEQSASRPGRFTPGERATVTHWIGGWVGLRTGLDDMKKRKFRPYRDSNSDSSAVQPVASHYVYRAIMSPKIFKVIEIILK
jgi:hypothetical protein